MRAQDLIARLLERKPARRLGMLACKAADVKRHKWFDAIDWDALEARRVEPPRKPRDDSAKRLKELQARPPFGIFTKTVSPELFTYNASRATTPPSASKSCRRARL